MADVICANDSTARRERSGADLKGYVMIYSYVIQIVWHSSSQKTAKYLRTFLAFGLSNSQKWAHNSIDLTVLFSLFGVLCCGCDASNAHHQSHRRVSFQNFIH
jgi:hypothetical protein